MAENCDPFGKTCTYCLPYNLTALSQAELFTFPQGIHKEC
ncbi:hypothetical protein H229_0289 [Klebsiella pneumoniae UHKPC02]|nr:hypothetical protein H223_0076 [Klebsiella pneumoniae UHKPC59]EPO84016.1 hypothetical protein H229_0289 [Klebsiella pneumoniae UHKPC02]CDK61476.1 hypothetical protein [Klebsiella pneumoniae IS10]